MSETLRILQVEDSESHAELIVRLFENAGCRVHAQRVEDAEEMRAALNRDAWDVVIADHEMAHFDAPGALRILQESGRDIPFIVTSESIGEELAVAMMKSGVHDHVLKHNLARLVPAVERELREACFRRDRRQAEQDLGESQERLALAIEATQFGTFDFFPQTGKLIWSGLTKRHLGLPPGVEPSIDAFLGTLHPDDRERVQTTVESLLRPGSGGQYAAEYRTIGIEDGVERHVSSWGRVYFDPEGQPVRFVGGNLDISERKRLEGQFFQAQKLESVGRLAGGVAHDFNNLLTVINGYSDMLLRKLSPGDGIHDLVSEIRIAGERAAALTGQLLVLSRKQVVLAKEVNVNEIVVEVERLLRRVIGDDVRMESVLSSSLGRVLAEPGQLHQVLMNLAINARDAMPGGGTLSIETGNVDLDDGFAEDHAEVKPGRYVQLSVSDTGSGMTEEVKSHLFEPFFTTKKVGEGTGLGLATVHGIVKQSGGSIWVYSEPGEGTTFKIYLPRIDPAGIAPDEPKPASPTLLGTETILLVEDQEQVRKMAVRVLRSHGYTVYEAANPAQALLHCERSASPIHLLLTDVSMPGMSGPKLAGLLKPLRPSMEVLFMSGYTERAITDRLESAGSYLAKPFSPDALAAKVREVLGARRRTGTIVVAGDERSDSNPT
jgi:two-component system cell cycle sensor histidine kinase/response regulator CckA